MGVATDFGDHADKNSPNQPNIADLVDRHYRSLYGYAYRLSGSPADAEDLVQQAFLIAQQKLHQLRNPEAARGWLFRVLRNHFLKSKQRGKSVQLADDVLIDLGQIAAEIPEGDWVDGELLQLALDELSVDFRTVLVMFYFEQLSYREIADALGLPAGTVMSRLSRGKRQLRRGLLERQKDILVTTDSSGGRGSDHDRS